MNRSGRSRRLQVSLAVLVIASLCLAACEQPTGGGVTPEPPTPTVPPTPSPTPDVTGWKRVDPVLAGYRDPPGEQPFKVSIEKEEIGTTGGEILFKVDPVGFDCSQLFRVGWDFVETDVAVVAEGERIAIQVYNQPEAGVSGGLNECYLQAKQALYWGGELTITLQGPGGSHFAYQPEYVQYFQADSGYLFALTQATGMVYPAPPEEPHNLALGELWVKNGIHEVGDANTSYGNFSFAIAMGGVFWYTVTYLYDPA